MIDNQLKQLGFNKNEVKVYLALFELGKCKAGQIIEHTGLHRNLVYTALEELVNKSLVSKVEKDNVFHFEANSPETLFDLVNQQKNIAEEAVLELKKKQEAVPRDIKIFDGVDGIFRARERSLSLPPNETVYVLGASQLSSTPEMENRWRKYHLKRSKKNINLKILYDRSTGADILEWRNNLPLTEARYLPFNIETPNWFEIFGDTLGVGVPGENPVTFSIRSKETADGFKKYFEYFWNQQVTIETGIESLEKTIYEMLDELKSGEEYFVLGASAGDENSAVQKLYDKFHTDRIKKGVVTNMLVYSESFDRIKKRFVQCGDGMEKISHLKLYASAPKIPMQINLFHDKAFIILYGENPTVIHFAQSELYAGFKAYFDQLWHQETTVTKGFNSFTKVWTDLFDELGPNDSYDVMGAAFGIGDEQERYSKFFRQLHEKRIARGIKGRILFQQGAEEVVSRYKMDALYNNNQTIKVLPYKNEFPVEIFFHKDKTLMLIQEKEPVLIVINNQKATKSFENHFNELWGQESYVLKGPKALQEIWLEIIDYKELRLIGARGYFIDRYPELFKKIEEKAKKIPGVKWKNIVDLGVKEHKITKFPWAETRYNLSTVKNPNVVWLYGNKVIIANWAGDEPVMFVSTNKHLVQSYQDYFNELWNKK